MVIYWLLLAASIGIGIPLCKVKHGKLIYCIVFGVALFLVAALRYDVGYDYNLYASWYFDVQSHSIADLAFYKQEKGFFIPMKLLTYISIDYQAMFVVLAFIFAVSIMAYIYFNAEKPYLSVFCFLSFGLFFNSMNFMRQMIAAFIVLYALKYIEKKEPLRFFVLVLFASCFHVSALIMVVFYFLLQIKMNWITLGVYSGLMVLFFLFSTDILKVITKYVYKGYNPESNIEVILGMNPIYAVFFGIFFLAAFLLRKPLVEKDPFNNVLINCMFFTFMFECIGVKHGILARFVILFFIPAIVILVPQVVLMIVEKCEQKLKNRKKGLLLSKTVAVTLFFAICTGMYGYMTLNNYNGVYPYQTIFERPVSDGEE